MRRAPQALPLLLVLLGAAGAPAQERIAPGTALEIDSRSRWLHGRQVDRFTPRSEAKEWIVIDSTDPAGVAGGTLHLTLDLPGRDGGATVQLGDGGELLALDAWPPGYRAFPTATAEDSVRSLRYAFGSRDELRLPATLVWELLPALRPQRLAAGVSWTEPIDLSTELYGARQALRGERTRRVVGDTMVEGRRLWIVRDSAAVEYEERWPHRERTLGVDAVTRRAASGVVRGRWLFDPHLPMAHSGADTTLLQGEAVLEYPDGRHFRTPARYERTRIWRCHDAAGRAARRAEIREASARQRTGMLILPTTAIERRLSEGDTVLRDSILTAWGGETDPDARSRLYGLVEFWGGDSRAFGDSLAALAFAAGDTTGHLGRLHERVRFGRGGYRPSELALLLPFLRDPGLAFAFGLERDRFYESVQDALLDAPPAITPDTSAWPCTPEACRILAAQRTEAEEPRLRDLGLIAALVLEPARWDEEVLARADAGSGLLREAALLVRGVGATWSAAVKAPLPPAGATWREWLSWMNGRSPTFRPGIPTLAREQAVRFEESHAVAIRFYSARTGREVVGELRRKLDEARSDSALLVYDAMLVGLGARVIDPEQVADRLLTGGPAARERAIREAGAILRDAPQADTVTTVALLDRLLAIVIEGAEPWPILAPGAADRGRRLGRRGEGGGPLFLGADSLPDEVRERWKDRVRLVEEDPGAAIERRGTHFRTSGVVRVGRLARLTVSYTSFIDQGPGRPPHGYAGGLTVFLVLGPDGWRTAQVGEWIT